MAQKGTRGATSAAVAEKDEDLRPQTSANFVAMSRGGVKSAAAPAASGHLLQEPSTRQGAAARHEDESPPPATAAAAPPPSAVDDVLRRVIALEIADDTKPLPAAAAAAQPRVDDDLLKRVVTLDVVDDNNSQKRSNKARKQIENIPQLKQELEGMCRTVSAALGRQQTESAYQLALGLELQLRGVVVQREAKILIMYRGRSISSRRVDLLLTVADGSTAIVEMKAVQTITKGTNLGAVHQLQYYLDVFDVDHGFLVNFPHDTGFPPPPNGGVFRQESICGVKGPLSDVRVRERKGSGVGEGPEIVYFQRVSP